MSKSEIIVKVGAEGGSVTLFGTKVHGKWHFSRRSIDQTPELLDGGWVINQAGVVDSFDSAIKLLDQYPWYHLYPESVHPEFRQKVYEAMWESCRAGGSDEPRKLAEWQHVCGMVSEG